MKLKREPEVLVAGAGPVGLFAAACLARHGVEVEILDKEWRGSAHSYALALHPATLRLLDEHGLAEELIELGHRIDSIGLYRGTERVSTLPLSELEGPFPFVLVLPQSRLENLLGNYLDRSKMPVKWNHEVLSIEPGPDGVEVDVGRMDKVSLGYPVARTDWVVSKRFRVKPKFMIGADGYYSFTRQSIGLAYPVLGPATRYAVFEFESPADLENEVRVVFHDPVTDVLWPMKDNNARWSFELARAHPPNPTLEGFRQLLASRAPWFTPVPETLSWGTTVRFEPRLAEAWGRGRVWLAGDSAHVTGPIGVQSMNVGLLEAADLADRLVRILRDGAAPGVLEEYETDHRKEWRSLLGLDGDPEVDPKAPAWVAEIAPRLIATLPSSGADLEALLGKVGLNLL